MTSGSSISAYARWRKGDWQFVFMRVVTVPWICCCTFRNRSRSARPPGFEDWAATRESPSGKRRNSGPREGRIETHQARSSWSAPVRQTSQLRRSDSVWKVLAWRTEVRPISRFARRRIACSTFLEPCVNVITIFVLWQSTVCSGKNRLSYAICGLAIGLKSPGRDFIWTQGQALDQRSQRSELPHQMIKPH